MRRGLTPAQASSAAAVYELLAASRAHFRLDRCADTTTQAVWEIRLHGKHHAFVHVSPGGGLKFT